MLLSLVTNALIAIRRTQDWLRILCELAGVDRNGQLNNQGEVLVLVYVVEILLASDRVHQAVKILAQALKRYPMCARLLHKQAECFMKLEFFEYAQKLSKLCIDLEPSSFEPWYI
jgi:predicted Zn-dependent protease